MWSGGEFLAHALEEHRIRVEKLITVYGLDRNLGLDFDRYAERQFGHTNGGARMPAALRPV